MWGGCVCVYVYPHSNFFHYSVTSMRTGTVFNAMSPALKVISILRCQASSWWYNLKRSLCYTSISFPFLVLTTIHTSILSVWLFNVCLPHSSLSYTRTRTKCVLFCIVSLTPSTVLAPVLTHIYLLNGGIWRFESVGGKPSILVSYPLCLHSPACFLLHENSLLKRSSTRKIFVLRISF